MRTLLLLFICSSLVAGDYKIAHINGTIFNTTQKKNLSIGDVLNDEDKLELKSSSGKCFILNAQLGKFTIDLTSKTSTKVKQIKKEVVDRKPISSRGGESGTSPIIKLSDYFGDDKYVFFDSTETVFVNTFYLMTNEKVSYLLKKESKTLPIKSSAGALEFNFLNVKRISSNEKIEIVQLNKESGAFKNVGNVFLADFSEETLKKEVGEFVSEIKKNVSTTTNDKIINQVSSFIEDVYGKHNRACLEKWLKAQKFII